MGHTYGARREDSDGSISGGRFVPAANRVLPVPRWTKIQGGRFVQPAADEVLPPPRETEIQTGVGIDWDQYHFGGIARMNRR